MMSADRFRMFAQKMEQAEIPQPAIQAFHNSYENLLQKQSGLIPESGILPVSDLPRLDEIQRTEDKALLRQTVVIKLNGGLGSSMGLEGPKSLLPVKNGLTFLDFIARQIVFLRQAYGEPPRFLLMNSFSTSGSSLDFLKKYSELGDPAELELMQGQVPKVDAVTLEPVSWPANPHL